MSEENIFKNLAMIKKYPSLVPSRGCTLCISGLVHVRHSKTKHAFVYKCLCALGSGRRENYKVWDNDINFEPI